ncbi:protein kinase C-binding protein 1 isoform X2 [Nasonia vitripennis]|uniref:Protein kinase C-binding protein 1 n=1 Tax=Nasonia vitripennis TaxID=7425 RepID=A0A7M7INK3_NASVI|nr:protein kinase C-binding protein 1 isoform X2 [Nasonia vitripennis]
MESHESPEDKNLETSKEIEVSNSVEDKESENESDEDSSDDNMVIEENEKSETEEDMCKKTNETEKNIVEPEDTDSAKINTLPNDSITKEKERKKDDDKSAEDSEVIKEIESAELDTPTQAVTSVTPKDTNEINRKRKSTNTPPVRSSPVEQQQNGGVGSDGVASKRKRLDSKTDRFCWRCHKESVETQCSACPRSWHRRCMGGAPPLSVTNWICGECAGILQAENAETRSQSMAQLTVDQLCMMLKHVVERMRDQHGSQPFWKAVDLNEVPNYLEYVVKPMDLSLLESNVRAKLYGSTDAFMADAKWIQHNCIVFNTCGGVYADTSKLTNTAKQMLKVARQEVSEIEACPDCFAHGRNLPRPLPSWFVEPCRRPHPIVWAKLKGFPFWPAKAMPRLNTQGLVDVRFFGEHDRAWVSPKDIYLYSQEPPVALPKKKKLEMEQCVKEVEEHSKKLEQVFGEFRYASPKVQYDPHDQMQIQLLLPNYDPSQNSRTAAPKADSQQPQVNNKSVTLKVDKKPQPEPKSTIVASTNGVAESTPIEKRKLVRKKKTVESPQPSSVNKASPEIETIIVDPKSKSQSRSPPATPTLLVNNNISKEKSKSKSPESPDIAEIIEVSPSGPPKKSVVAPIRKLKGDVINKRPSSEKDVDHQDEPLAKKPNVIKNANGKPNTIVHSMPGLNSLQNHSDIVKTVSPGQKPKTIYIHSNMRKSSSLVPVNSKFSAKSPQSEIRLVNKGLNKSVNKEATRFPVNNIQRSKDDSLSNSSKPMTAIPVSAKKDQKAMYHMMNSNTSESAKHLSEKDTRLSDPITAIKQEPKDDVSPKVPLMRKPGKARKSFPNKPPSFPQVMTPTTSATPPSSSSSSSYPLTKAAASANDAMVYIPPQSNDLRSSAYELPPPEAGPATAQIHNTSRDLANRVAQLIAETIKEAAENNAVGGGSVVNHHEATIHYLKLRMERLKWEHKQEMAELKHNNELVLRELKASMEVEKFRAVQDVRREAEADKLHSIEETKRKQWCVVCGREAMFYCCWNTAYCDYPCQQKHWASHITTCGQKTQVQTQTQKTPQQQQKSGSSSSQSVLKSQQNGNICNEIRILTTGSM